MNDFKHKIPIYTPVIVKQSYHIYWDVYSTVAPKTFVKIDGYKNIYNFMLKFFAYNLTYEAPFTVRNSTDTEVPAFTFGQTKSSIKRRSWSYCSLHKYIQQDRKKESTQQYSLGGKFLNFNLSYITICLVNSIINIGNSQNFYSSCSIRHSPWQGDECIFRQLLRSFRKDKFTKSQQDTPADTI